MTLVNGPCDCADPSKVHELWAYVAADEAGEEGIVAVPSSLGITPLVGADRERMRSLRGWAERAAHARGKPVELRRYHVVEAEIEVIAP